MYVHMHIKTYTCAPAYARREVDKQDYVPAITAEQTAVQVYLAECEGTYAYAGMHAWTHVLYLLLFRASDHAGIYICMQEHMIVLTCMK